MELILTPGRPPNALYKLALCTDGVALRIEEIRLELPKIGPNQFSFGKNDKHGQKGDNITSFITEKGFKGFNFPSIVCHKGIKSTSSKVKNEKSIGTKSKKVSKR